MKSNTQNPDSGGTGNDNDHSHDKTNDNGGTVPGTQTKSKINQINLQKLDKYTNIAVIDALNGLAGKGL